MDDNTGGQKKPLRTPSNKIKDLYNAYVRNEGTRNIPVNVPEQDKEKKSEDTTENIMETLTEDETVFIEEIQRLNGIMAGPSVKNLPGGQI